jgi:cytochrome c
MKKLLWNSLFISLLILVGCNSSSKGNHVKIDQEEVKDYSVYKNDMMPLEQGLSFAMQTQKVLAINLMNEINTKGAVHAFTFCSAKAYTLTDSMALALNVQIKRVSDKPRNPNNKANKQEATYIAKSKEFLAKGENAKPEMTETKGKMVGYYPIITNQICMQCHGNQGTEVLSETLLRIKELYPKDKGIDYKINELRGIWVVEMNKK